MTIAPPLRHETLARSPRTASKPKRARPVKLPKFVQDIDADEALSRPVYLVPCPPGGPEEYPMQLPKSPAYDTAAEALDVAKRHGQRVVGGMELVSAEDGQPFASILFHVEKSAPPLDPPTIACSRTHVDHAVEATGGTVRLLSASGPYEAVWLHVHGEDGQRMSLDRATGRHLAAAVMLSPSEARTLAAALWRYASTHKDTPE